MIERITEDNDRAARQWKEEKDANLEGRYTVTLPSGVVYERYEASESQPGKEIILNDCDISGSDLNSILEKEFPGRAFQEFKFKTQGFTEGGTLEISLLDTAKSRE